MSSHSDEVLLKFGELQVISVRRRHVWEDTVDFLSKPFIDWRCPLYIHFVGEPAQVEGGPKREFFRLSLQGALNDSNIFRGYQVVYASQCQALTHFFKNCILNLGS